MSRLKQLTPVIGGAVAGGVIALVLASGGSSNHSTTTVVQPSTSASIPTSLAGQRGLTVNQIYRRDSPGDDFATRVACAGSTR